MKTFFGVIILTTFFPLLGFALSTTDCTITSTLRIGSKGAQVECLQTKIGASVDGNFGPKTANALKAFQFKVGLKSDGIAGPITRSFLMKTAVKAETVPKSVVNSTDNSKKTASSSPNMQYLDGIIKTVTKVSKDQGFSDEQIVTLTKAVTDKVANSTKDYFEEFQEAHDKVKTADNSNKGKFTKFIDKTFSFLKLKPEKAYALTGAPFGGAILVPFPCFPEGVGPYALYITPLAPTNVGILTYYLGTQNLYPNFNLPNARFLLGAYTPPVTAAGYGLTDCILVPPAPPVTYTPIYFPTEGLITPMVGSSL